MKKSCLIIGGAGYIGSSILSQISKKYNVIVFDKFLFIKKETISLKFNNIKFIQGDINYDLKPSLFKNINTVIHLAGLANDITADFNPNNTVLTNYVSTLKIVRYAKMKNVSKFIYASSCSVYGDYGSEYATENSIPKPLTVYALSKFSSESEILKFSDSSFEVVSLRFATLFGFSYRMRFDLGINAMTKDAIKNKLININGNGKQYRAFVHVRDVARCIIFFLENNKKLKYKIYNVGSNFNNIKIIKLINVFKKLFLNIRVNINNGNLDFRSYKVSFDRLNEIYSTKDFTKISDGIIDMITRFNSKSNFQKKIYYNLKVLKNK